MLKKKNHAGLSEENAELPDVNIYEMVRKFQAELASHGAEPKWFLKENCIKELITNQNSSTVSQSRVP